MSENSLKKIESLEERNELRSKIAVCEEQMKALEQREIELKHYFSKGIYAREIKIPADTIIVGKIHKHENLNILSQGEITVISIDGAKRMKAPCTIVSSPGVKRIAYTHTETVWTTIHGTEETDLEKIEELFIAKDYEEVPGITSEELRLLKGE